MGAAGAVDLAPLFRPPKVGASSRFRKYLESKRSKRRITPSHTDLGVSTGIQRDLLLVSLFQSTPPRGGRHPD